VALAAATSQLAIYVLNRHTISEVLDAKSRDAALARMEQWAQKAEKTPKTQSAFEHWSARTLIEFKEGRYPAAKQSLSYVKHEGRANYFYYFANAAISVELGDWRAAHQDLTKALDLEPTALEARCLRAVVRSHTEDFTNALTDARKAVEIAPARSPFTWLVYVLRAHIYHELHENDAAAVDLEKAGALEKTQASSIRVLKNRWRPTGGR